MSNTKQWSIAINIDERRDERTTTAVARLDCGPGQQLTGRGTAVRFPRDLEVPAVGDDLAAARALRDLAGQLAANATADLDGARARLGDNG